MPAMSARKPTVALATAFQIDPLGATYANTGFTTAYNTTNWKNGALSNTAQNDTVTFGLDAPLRGGTWALTLLCRSASDRGICTIEVSPDAATWTTLTTVDFYNAVNTTPDRKTNTGLTMPQGTRYMRFTMATKNASSSAYVSALQGITGVRTGN